MDKYAVIGNPVEHSLSPIIHAHFAKQTHQDLEYNKILAPLNNFAATIKDFQQAGGKGCNVTVPFKEQAFQLADSSSHVAQLAKAANTLCFAKDGSIFADNTDGTGLSQDLNNNHHYSSSGKKILIIGAGGATRGILYPLLKMAPCEVVVANRTANKAYALAEMFKLHGPIIGLGFEQLTATPYDLIIHATSVGHGGQCPELPQGLIHKNSWCYDLSYGSAAKPFLHWAKTQGAKKCVDGMGMLVEQAAASFYLWRKVHPSTQKILKTLLTKSQESHCN